MTDRPMREQAADLRVVACNYREGISAVPGGALCYLLGSNNGWGGERVEILARSRSGRWIEKWEDSRKLTNFRAKTIPPEHRRYKQLRFRHVHATPEIVGQIRTAAKREHVHL